MSPGIYATAVIIFGAATTVQEACDARVPTVHNKYLHRFVKGLRFWGVSAGSSRSLKALQTHTQQRTCIYNSRCVCVGVVCGCAIGLRSVQVDLNPPGVFHARRVSFERGQSNACTHTHTR